ncbi:MAG: sugar phosphate isomerase/epimerase family protein [Planctomycetota bacterium]|jgi:sugar phosphate isomerase/epimerase
MIHQVTRRRFLNRAALTGACVALGVRPAAVDAALPYTAKEISARLGISMAVYQKERLGARHIAAVRAAGIRHIELTMIPDRIDIHDRAQISELLTECKRQKVRIVSIHGNLQLKYNHPDEQKRRAAAEHLLDEIRFAEKAGADIVVAHFGTNDQSRKTVTELLDKTKDMPIRLTVENMRGGLKPYAAFVDRIGSNRFGMTVDIGHIRDDDGVNPMVKKGRAGDVLAEGGKRIRHLHLHETFDLETKPDHRAPMHPDGIIEWGEVFSGLEAIDYRGIFLFEDGRGENPEQWVRLAGDFPDNFASRYGP